MWGTLWSSWVKDDRIQRCRKYIDMGTLDDVDGVHQFKKRKKDTNLMVLTALKGEDELQSSQQGGSGGLSA